MALVFWKYEGTGKDFVLLCDAEVTSDEVRRLCDHHCGIGTDGSREKPSPAAQAPSWQS